jgi:hypothetical protein
MIPITAPVPVAVAAPAAIEPAPSFNESDLARLRELIQSAASQTANPQGLTPATDPTGAVEGVRRTFGDTILEGMMRFGNNYQSSLSAIEGRLQDVVKSEGSGLTNFSEILALQIDVSKWSMSVMGVDNAAKAGANTVKELSRGG